MLGIYHDGSWGGKVQFEDVEAVVYYPSDQKGWDQVAGGDYGGSLQ